ncbi:MAG: DUF3352 domain-containing protein [Acidobacteriia bacterium]|nr:DUF3352 domain-containing protein [Terriglobia bacterium]
MLKALHSPRQRKLALAMVGILVLALAALFLMQPKPFNAYVPADCIGYLEIPNLEDVIQFIRDPGFKGESPDGFQTPTIRPWLETLLNRFEVTPRQLNATQVGLILTSASAETGQTIKLNAVLVVRVHSFWVKNLKLAPRTIGEKLALPNSFISTETLGGKDVAVLSRSQPEQRIFIAVYRDAVLLGNQREALGEVLSAMEGLSPSITDTTTWKTASPKSPDRSVLLGFFAGPSLLNLLRDFLVRNYPPFEDPARTSRFLDALGLNGIQAIHYSAQAHSSEVRDLWHFQVADRASATPSLISIFVHQTGKGMELIPLSSIPSNTASVRYISAIQSKDMWSIFANALGILTDQEAPQNRDLMIAMFEGALGFHIQRDLLANLSGAVALLEIEGTSQTSFPGKGVASRESGKGWLLAFKSQNPSQLQKAFSKIIAEDRQPKSQQVGSITVFFSDLESKSRRPFGPALPGVPAYALRGDILFFAPDKDVLVAAAESLQQKSDALNPSLPPALDPHAPYFSLTLAAATGDRQGAESQPRSPLRSRMISASEIKEEGGGFRYLQVSSCGFLCVLLDEGTRAVH